MPLRSQQLLLMTLMQLCLNMLYHVLLSLYIMCEIYHGVKEYSFQNLKLLMLCLKADHSMVFNNYQLVSIACALSKFFEKAMYNRHLTYYVTGQTHNCSWKLRIYNWGVSGIPKGLDTNNHQILFDKLYRYGVCRVAISWCKSYPSNRYQFVTYNGIKFSQQLMRCGVPQGPILGLLLFLIYINELSMVCKHAMLTMFPVIPNFLFSG